MTSSIKELSTLNAFIYTAKVSGAWMMFGIARNKVFTTRRKQKVNSNLLTWNKETGRR